MIRLRFMAARDGQTSINQWAKHGTVIVAAVQSRQSHVHDSNQRFRVLYMKAVIL